jgi:hypothetical protein
MRDGMVVVHNRTVLGSATKMRKRASAILTRILQTRRSALLFAMQFDNGGGGGRRWLRRLLLLARDAAGLRPDPKVLAW